MKYNQIGSRKIRIIFLNKYPLKNPLVKYGFAWFWIFFQFWTSGLNGNKMEKEKYLVITSFCLFLNKFLDLFLILRNIRYFQYL